MILEYQCAQFHDRRPTIRLEIEAMNDDAHRGSIVATTPELESDSHIPFRCEVVIRQDRTVWRGNSKIGVNASLHGEPGAVVMTNDPRNLDLALRALL